MSQQPKGPLTSARLVNNTGGLVTLSLYLNKTVFGECGYRSFRIDKHSSVIADDLPQGCYWAGAFVDDPKAKTKSFGDNLCINTPGRLTITVNAERITH
jgi:hypothetical protein